MAGVGAAGWIRRREAFLLTLFAEDSQRWQQGGGGVMLLTERAHPGRGGASEGCEWHEAWLVLRDWPKERPKGGVGGISSQAPLLEGLERRIETEGGLGV